jgi:hypothetical protein
MSRTARRSTTARHQPRSYTRRTYIAAQPLRCNICTQPIPTGDVYYQDRTKAASHPVCRRIGVKAAVDSPRYLFDSPLGVACAGCGYTIEVGERVVHVLTQPWHPECRLRR